MHRYLVPFMHLQVFLEVSLENKIKHSRTGVPHQLCQTLVSMDPKRVEDSQIFKLNLLGASSSLETWTSKINP